MQLKCIRRDAFLPIAILLWLGGGCGPSRTRPRALVAQRSALSEARALVGLDVVASRGYDGSGVTVAVIDSGIDATHPDLAGKVIDEACFCNTGSGACCPGNTSSATGAGSAADDNGHGTSIAGIIASQGTQSPRGGAPGAQIVAVKVLDSSLAFDVLDVVDALDWVATAHPEVKVINLSLGTQGLYGGDCDAVYMSAVPLQPVLDDFRANGVLVVAASGNDRSSTMMAAPACIASVLSVGAVWDSDVGPQSTYCTEVATAADQIGCYSDASPTLDVLAPGGPTESTWPGGGTQTHIGTSEAAPIVSACAAALLQADPTLSADSLEALLESTGVSVNDARNGAHYPRIDCAAALAVRVPLPPEPDAGADEDAGAAAGDGGDMDGGGALDAGGAAGGSGNGGTGGSAGSAGNAGSASEAGAGGAPAVTMDAAIGSDDSGTPTSGGDAAEPNMGNEAGGSSRDAGRAGSPAAEDGGEPGAIGGNGGRGIVAVRGGGCGCEISGSGRALGPGWLLFAAASVMRVRRRRRRAAG